jgi:hypothetical protein
VSRAQAARVMRSSCRGPCSRSRSVSTETRLYRIEESGNLSPTQFRGGSATHVERRETTSRLRLRPEPGLATSPASSPFQPRRSTVGAQRTAFQARPGWRENGDSRGRENLRGDRSASGSVGCLTASRGWCCRSPRSGWALFRRTSGVRVRGACREPAGSLRLPAVDPLLDARGGALDRGWPEPDLICPPNNLRERVHADLASRPRSDRTRRPLGDPLEPPIATSAPVGA